MSLELAQAQALLTNSKPNPDKAIETLNRLLKKNKSSWLTYHYMGVAQLQKQQWETGINYLKKALEKGSDEPETYHLISVGHYQLAEFGSAEDYAKMALDRNPEYLEGWLNLGSVYKFEGRLDEALDCYKKANQIDSKNAGVAFRIAAVYKDQGDLNKALELFDITIKLDEGYLEAYAEKAVIFQKLRRFDEAKATLKEIIEKDPKHLGAHVGLADVYKVEGRYEEAIRLYKDMIRMYPKVAGIKVNYALCLQEMGEFDESEEKYLEAVKAQPDLLESYSNYLMGLHYNPNRSKEEIFEEHLKWDKMYAVKNPEERPVPLNIRKGKKLRIGFISGGFRAHPVGWMITKALENLPEDEFEVFCYTTSNLIDDLTRRIHRRAITWRSLVGYNDEINAHIIRHDKIDILVELSGHSEDNRLRTVTLNPAPIVVKWVGGLFNTSGLKSIDYLLTDWHETPEGEEEFYTEKLVRMPDDYICFLPPDYSPEVKELPARTNGYVTFGCFNNPNKINNALLEQWARLLNEIPDAKLFLKSRQYGSELYVTRLIKRMEDFGIDAERLIFEGESTHDGLLDAYNKVDIALDPWPYSGGLTTCEALWMGVPVITYPGPTFAGRHAASHLANAGFGDLVVDSWDAYIGKAKAMSSDLNILSEIRSGMREAVNASPMCDGPLFGAHLTKAFRAMWEQRVDGYENNLPEGKWQDHIAVEALTEKEKSKLIRVVEEPVKKPVNRNEYKLHTTPGHTISTPKNLNSVTTFVTLEQDAWYEDEVQLLSELLSEADSFVDVGAAFGAYALPAAGIVGKKGKVFAFEASEKTAEHLKSGKEENGFGQLEVIQKAVGAQSGTATFNNEEIPEASAIDENGSETVNKISLDDWWSEQGNPAIKAVKIDVNGAEAEVLKGAEALLSKKSPAIILSVTGGEESSSEAVNVLASSGYKLFDYVPGTGILTEHDLNSEKDPYQASIIALSSKEEDVLRKRGVIFNAEAEPEIPAEGYWAEVLSEYSWATELMSLWKEQSGAEEAKEYYKAIDYICAAERMDPGETHSGTKKSKLMLAAASILIEYYNAGSSSTSLAFTLVRVLNKLGKRGQAVEILKNLIETTHLGQQNMDVSLPFLPPFDAQDASEISTDLSKWLMVRTIESWILMKDISAYFSSDQELKLLELLHTNPEVLPEIEKRFALVSLKNNKAIPESGKKFIAESFSNSSNHGIIGRLFGVDIGSDHGITLTAEGSLSQKKIFTSEFWDQKITPGITKKIYEFIQRFHSEEFSNELIKQVVDECRDRLRKVPHDNVPFFVQVHALLALSGEEIPDGENTGKLEEALKVKKWIHKTALYKYWFSDVEYRSEISNPKVSAIVISNKFKEKSVENLKRLSAQLEGLGEVILVNNGIPDSEFDPLIEYVDTYVKLNGNSGAYLARNMGAAFAKGDYLLYVDDDGIPDEGMIGAHLKEHEERDILVSRGAYYSDDPGDDPFHYHIGSDEVCPAITLLEGNAMYKSEAFYEVGGWGDYILFGHGGKELSFRLLEVDPDKEKQIYTPYSRLNHNFIRGLNHQQNKVVKQTRSSFLLWSMHKGFRSETESWPDTFSKPNQKNSKIPETNPINKTMEYTQPAIDIDQDVKGSVADATSIEKVTFVTPVAKSKGGHGLHELFAAQNALGFDNRGVETDQISLSDPELLQKLSRISNQENQAVFGGLSGYNIKLDLDKYEKKNVYDMLGIRVFGQLADQPFADFMLRRLEHFPTNGVLFSPSQSLLDAFQTIYKHDVPVEVLDRVPPVFTRDEEIETKPFNERSIDILVPWGLHKFFENQKPLQEKLKEYGDPAVKLGGMIYKQAMEDYGTPIMDMFAVHTKALFGNSYEFNKEKNNVDYAWLRILHMVDFQIRLDRRLRMLVELFKTNTDKRIVITADPEIGKAFQGISDSMNIEWIGEIPANDLEKMYGDAKIVLSCNPTFPDVVHERIRNAMYFGACVISDYNTALQEHFGEKGGILFMDNTAENLGELLSSPDELLTATAETGNQIVRERFSLEDYIGRFHQLLNKYNQQ